MAVDPLAEIDHDRRMPTVDVVAHLRHLVRALPVALVAALVIAGVVSMALAKPVKYQASVVAQIVTTSPIQSPTDLTGIAAIVGPYVQLSHDSNVMRSIAVDAGVGMTPSELSGNISVAAEQTAGLLDISATASDAATAQRIATSTVKSMNAAYQQTQSVVEQPDNAVSQAETDLEAAIGGARPTVGDPSTNFLQTKMDNLKAAIANSGVSGVNKQYLVLLSSPTGGVTKTGGLPWTIAIVVFLVAFIVVAELVVFGASRYSRRVNPVWAHSVARKAGLPLRFGSTAGGLPLKSEMQLTEAARHAVVLALVSDENLLPDGLNAATYPLDGRWWPDYEYSQIGMAVVVVAEGEQLTRPAAEAIARLSEAGIPSQLIVIQDGGYFLGWHIHTRRPAPTAKSSASWDASATAGDGVDGHTGAGQHAR